MRLWNAIVTFFSPAMIVETVAAPEAESEAHGELEDWQLTEVAADLCTQLAYENVNAGAAINLIQELAKLVTADARPQPPRSQRDEALGRLWVILGEVPQSQRPMVIRHCLTSLNRCIGQARFGTLWSDHLHRTRRQAQIG